MTQAYDVIIVGAGIVGSSLACAIAQQKSATALRIAVIEGISEIRQYSGENFDPRVVALTQASQNLLAQVGVWEKISAQRACAYSEMVVWDGEGTASIHFSAAEVRQVYLGHIIENSVIVSALREKLLEHKNIKLIQPAMVTGLVVVGKTGGEFTQILLDDGSALTTELLIAADGANSKVRELAEFVTYEWDYGHTAVITTVQTELPNRATAWQRFMRTGPLAFLPLPCVDGKHFCSIVWSAEHALADEILALNDADFCLRLALAFEKKLGNIVQTAVRFSIPLRQRHAKEYIKPQIVLVGDAAHNIHPLAGQGVNLGLSDVFALAQEIERAGERGVPLNDFSILCRYQRRRLGDNLIMMSAMEAFKRLFGNNSLEITWLRNMGMRQLDSLSVIKKFIVNAAAGLH